MKSNGNGHIKTLIFTEQFLPADGGSINWLLNTYTRYPPKEVVCVAAECQGDKKADQSLPFRVERIPMNFSCWDPTRPAALVGYFKAIRWIRQLIRKHHSEQIHVVRVMPEGLVAWCVNRLGSIPYILYAHGEEIQTGNTSRTFSYLMPKIYNGAEAIIANSRNTKSLLEGIGVDPERIHIIHPGVSAGMFKSDEASMKLIRQKYGLEDSPVLLTIGRLQRRKGQDMVIQALPLIQKNFPLAKYIVVGTGEEEGHLKQLAREHGCQKSVIFAGRVRTEELEAYYGACDVFIMPNREIGADIEGFGMVYLEAAAAGKPVIGGKSGGTGDAIQDGVTGLRVDGESKEAVAEAVISLLSDPQKSKWMGENGRNRVQQQFTWESVYQQTQTLALTIHMKKNGR